MRKDVVRGVSFLLSLMLIVFLEAFVNVLSIFSNDDKVLVELEVLKSENERLKRELDNSLELYGLSDEGSSVIIGKVLIRDIYSFYDEIIINVGSEDGVSKGSAVINGSGLIGIVDKVYKGRSVVTLLSNKKQNLSVRINDSYGNLNDFVVSRVDSHDEINIGDLVYTSGLTDVKEGIYVGKVSGVSENKLGIEKYIEIESDVDYLEVNYVGVIR